MRYLKNFIRVDVVTANDVDKRLAKGWEIIETSKTAYDMGETTLNYHIGYSGNRLVTDLLDIIRKYEEHGLKDELIKRIALTNEDEINDIYEISAGTSFQKRIENSTVEFMKKYEAAVNNKNIEFVKKRDFSVLGEEDIPF
jgi:hypothetical protein